MNIISCDNCGVVLDKDKLNFPTNIYLDDGSVDCSKAGYSTSWRHGGEWVPKVVCPLCEADILDE